VGLDKPPAKDMRKRGRKPKNANGDSTSKIDKSGTNITAKRRRPLWMTSDAAQYAIDGSVAITSSPRHLKWILYSGKWNWTGA
jgi:hypothetical protein